MQELTLKKKGSLSQGDQLKIRRLRHNALDAKLKIADGGMGLAFAVEHPAKAVQMLRRGLEAFVNSFNTCATAVAVMRAHDGDEVAVLGLVSAAEHAFAELMAIYMAYGFKKQSNDL